MRRSILIALFSLSSLYGLEATFHSDSTSGYLGDVITFSWDIVHVPEESLNFGEIDLDGTGIEVLDRSLANIEGGSRLTYETAVYDSVGIYTFPSSIVYAGAAESLDSLYLRGPDIEIVSILVPSDTTFRDIKGIHEISTPIELIYFIAGFLILGVGFLIYYLLKRRKKSVLGNIPQKIIVPPEEAHLIALRALDTLKRSKYIRFEQFKDFYSELTFILKQYYENRFLIDALEQTTSEFLDTMTSMSEFETQMISETHELLELADFIKFAKGKSDELQAGKALTLAIDLVNRTKVQSNQGENT